MERRLAAILAADVAGYSRLMNSDEAGTLARLDGLAAEVIHPLIAEYNGRLIKEMGDGFLVEFSSALQCVECAVAWQQAVEARAGLVDKDQAIRFRIGLNLGDVISKRDDVFGDGVNIATRLESLAEPGGICASQKIANEVKQMKDIHLEDFGAQKLKNIAEPVRVLKVTARDDSVALASRNVAPSRAINQLGVVVSIAAIVALISGGSWWLSRSTAPESVQSAKIANPLTENPSIAVLPFDNLSNDPDQQYFSDGLTEDLITDLAQISELRVIARNSVFTYKGQAVKVQQVAKELGVNHVLEGSVRKVGDKVRFNVQLIDALTGGHIWAERFDRNLTDIFALQDEVAAKIIESLKLKLSSGEKSGLHKRYTRNVDAYEQFLRGQREFFRFNREGNLIAREYYQEATRLDPLFARAIANLGWTHARDYQDGWSESPEASLETALKFALQAAEIDSSSSQVNWVLGQVYLFKRNYKAALAAARKSIELSPSNPDPKILLARILAFSGDSKESARLIEDAIKTNPFYPMQYMMNLGIAHFSSGEYEKAEKALNKAIDRNPDAQRVRMWLVATYANSGKMEDAEWQYEELLTLNPSFSLANLEKSIPFRDPTVRDKLVAGIHAAAH